MNQGWIGTLVASIFAISAWGMDQNPLLEQRYIQVSAHDKYQRSKIQECGVSIEAVRSDSVWGFANSEAIRKLRASGYRVLGEFPFETGRGGHEGGLDFPDKDSAFHNYEELQAELRALEGANPDLARVVSIGKSLENRDILAIHINSSPSALQSGSSAKPGAIFMGNHHAREHLSVEVPLLLARHLLANRENASVATLLQTRDIWIIPMVNPDGAEFDVSSGRYRYWRKNRRDNGNGTMGVDLNRNYGYEWGKGGASSEPSSDVFRGPEAFSEPETRVIRDFVRSQPNVRTLLTFHSYSELILYPWGYTFDPIVQSRDKEVFEAMAQTMAEWNGYHPQQSSDLYITSGDTTDWAYGELGIFAFTFELSPQGVQQGGFYPGAGVIERVFMDNLRPALYLIEMAEDPYRAVKSGSSWSSLFNYWPAGQFSGISSKFAP